MFTKLAYFLSLLLMIGSVSLLSFSLVMYQGCTVYFIEMDLLNEVNSVSLQFLVLIDWMSCSFMSVVSLISSVVMMYSLSYMSQDKGLDKFVTLVLMFILSMFLMISSPNLFSILLGWDGLGLVSYCLVIYYQNWKSQSAGMITLLSNRLGDLAILLSICWCFNYGSFNMMVLQKIFIEDTSSSVLYLVLLAGMTKSAQIPFSAWLPAAMAAPTPVSSLVHSSTLVTAGVYLLIRFNFMVSMNYYLFFISVMTMLMSGISALFEMDLKKVIALSTLSQLGVMMLILSVGMPELSFFHLMSHALFKSLLFLCAGFYIHSKHDWQDIRAVSSLMLSFPCISLFFSVASLSLSGFPFLAGFYSKDLIIEYMLMMESNFYVMALTYLATMSTLAYSVRLIYLVYFYKIQVSLKINEEKEDFLMITPMTLLFLSSITGGSLLSWVVFPKGLIFISMIAKVMVLIGLLLVGILSVTLSLMKVKVSLVLSVFSLMWNLPILSSYSIQVLTNKSYMYLKLMDQGWLEYLGSQGFHNIFSGLSSVSDSGNSSNIKQVTFLMFILVLGLIFYI